MLTGVCRCFYHLGRYEDAIAFGQGAIKVNRSVKDVHKHVALSYKALGDIASAKATMARAVGYEIPFDDEQKAKNMKLYEEMAESATT